SAFGLSSVSDAFGSTPSIEATNRKAPLKASAVTTKARTIHPGRTFKGTPSQLAQSATFSPGHGACASRGGGGRVRLLEEAGAAARAAPRSADPRASPAGPQVARDGAPRAPRAPHLERS